MDCSSTPAAPWLARTRRQASQTIRLEITNGFAVRCGSLTDSSRHLAVDRRSSLDDPPPSLGPHYRASSLLRGGPPLRCASLLRPSRCLPLGRLALAPVDASSISL